MKTLARYALSIGVAAILLAGCGGLQPPMRAPETIQQSDAMAASSSYHVLYSFTGKPDGAEPTARLVDVNGTLYGTTSAGGTHICYDYGKEGCGTIFSITPGGKERVLHSFDGANGALPNAGLIDVNGRLYGTTTAGGANRCLGAGCGTVFSVSTSGREKLLHSFGFGSGSDGMDPVASLIDVKGTLYGTTIAGGTYGVGTVFSITTSGTEKVLHSFGGGYDGQYPRASLKDVKGTLYGTTFGGGANACRYSSHNGCGTVFSITRAGKEQVLYSFDWYHGDGPVAGLIDVNDTLYGTTITGGALSVSETAGTVFSISTSGTEKVLHSFGSQTGGFEPEASLINLRGKLYGTTHYYCCRHHGAGTVFSITMDGTEKVLHSFGKGSDGWYPDASLINVNGTLYGITSQGGTHGLGTVFALTP